MWLVRGRKRRGERKSFAKERSEIGYEKRQGMEMKGTKEKGLENNKGWLEGKERGEEIGLKRERSKEGEFYRKERRSRRRVVEEGSER